MAGFARLFDRQFEYGDIREVIRLALIGGGLEAKRSQELVETYVPAQPLIHSYSLAVEILRLVWFGKDGHAKN